MTKFVSQLFGIATILALVCLPPRSALGQSNHYWSSTAGGNWADSSKWSGGAPSSNDNAYFFRPNSGTVSVTSNPQTLNHVYFNPGFGSFRTIGLSTTALNIVGGRTVNAGGITVGSNTNGSFRATVNVIGSGRLQTFGGRDWNVNRFGTLNQSAGLISVGDDLNLSGNANFSGGSASVNDSTVVSSTGNLTLSGGSLATRNLQVNGGAFNHHAGSLQIRGGTFSGLGSFDLGGVVQSSTATIQIRTGGSWTTGSLRVGASTSAGEIGAGELLVDGAGSGVGATNLIVGRTFGATGQLTSQNGGSVSFSNLEVYSTGLVSLDQDVNLSGGQNVRMRGGDATITGQLNASGSSGVELSSNNSELTVGGLVLGSSANLTHSAGTLTIDGGSFTESISDFHIQGVAASSHSQIGLKNGATWSTAQLTVGENQLGTLSVESGASVSIASDLQIGEFGTVNLVGGMIEVNSIDVDAGSTFNVTDGTLVVDNFTGNLTQDGGVLSPGDSPGLTTITGDYNLNAGSVLFELDGLVRGTGYDALDITGDALLNGTLEIDLGFAPGLGDSFNLFSMTGGGSITGSPTFDFADAALGSGLAWNTSSFFSTGSISVSAVPEPSSLGIVAVAFAAASFRRRRERRR